MGTAWEAVNADTGVSNSGKSCKYERRALGRTTALEHRLTCTDSMMGCA